MEAKSSTIATPWSPYRGYCTNFKKISEYETVIVVTQESIYIPRTRPGILLQFSSSFWRKTYSFVNRNLSAVIAIITQVVLLMADLESSISLPMIVTTQPEIWYTPWILDKWAQTQVVDAQTEVVMHKLRLWTHKIRMWTHTKIGDRRIAKLKVVDKSYTRLSNLIYHSRIHDEGSLWRDTSQSSDQW